MISLARHEQNFFGPEHNCFLSFSLPEVDVAVDMTTLSIVASILGWVAFAAWSISFYPQVLLNYRRKRLTSTNFPMSDISRTHDFNTRYLIADLIARLLFK
jgi:hypothetical protein